MDNIEPVKKARKPRQPKQSNTTLTNTTNTVSNNQNNIDSSIIESIHTQTPPTTKSDNTPSTTTSKKITSKRGVKKNPAIASGSLDGILNQLDIQPTQNIILAPSTITETINSDKIIQLSSGSSITHIYHISDIHIQLYKRHQEYREVFQRVYDYLIGEKMHLASLLLKIAIFLS